MDRVPRQRSEPGLDRGELQRGGAARQAIAQILGQLLAFGVEEDHFRQ